MSASPAPMILSTSLFTAREFWERLCRSSHMRRVIERGRAVLQHSSILGSGSLEQQFLDLLRETVPGSGVEARVLVIGKSRALKPEVHHQIYLIGREAIVNSLRHSKPTSIEAEITYLRSHLRVVVRDNGCGFDGQILRSERASQSGLPSMRERAKDIGAEVRIFSRRGAGTEIEISLSRTSAAA